MNYRKFTSVCAFLSLFSFLVLAGISASTNAYAAEEPDRAASREAAAPYGEIPEATGNAVSESKTKSEAETPQSFAVGLRLGGAHFGVGANARYWSRNKLGFEIGYSRSSVGYSNSGVGYDASVNQVIPSVLYEITRVEKPTFTIKPYLGGGINISRSTAEAKLEGLGFENEKQSSTNFGGQGFVGLELKPRRIPRLAFGGDAGYYSTSAPFSGIKIGGFALTATVHYFLK